MGAQPRLKRGKIHPVAADLGFAVEEERHVPAEACPERRVGVDIDGSQAMPGTREQRVGVRFHFVAQRAAGACIEREC